MIKRDMLPIFIVIVAMIILNIIDGNFENFNQWIYNEILMLPGIIIGISFHEFAHGIVSYRLGDPTPKYQGRTTINPIAHIDGIGFLCLIFAGFGWGRPVQIDPRYYKHPRRDEFLVSIAGVVMNLFIAIIFSFILKFLLISNVVSSLSLGESFIGIVKYTILINLVLMVFNLLPIPPLDGFGIITQIFNLEKYSWYSFVYNNGMFILLAVVLFDIVGYILNPTISILLSLLYNYIIL